MMSIQMVNKLRDQKPNIAVFSIIVHNRQQEVALDFSSVYSVLAWEQMSGTVIFLFDTSPALSKASA